MQLPRLALSVRQPWAWAIFHGKDIENRDWRAPNPALKFRGAVCIHASQGMTMLEYETASDFIEQITGMACPPPAQLRRGGIVGVVSVTDIVKASSSPWFVGRLGLVLAQQREVEFIPAGGQLGYFEWKRDDSVTVEPAKWMKAWGATTEAAAAERQGALF